MLIYDNENLGFLVMIIKTQRLVPDGVVIVFNQSVKKDGKDGLILSMIDT